MIILNGIIRRCVFFFLFKDLKLKKKAYISQQFNNIQVESMIKSSITR